MLIPARDHRPLLPTAGILEAPVNPTRRFTADSPAIELMTDFHREQPIVVAPERHIEPALKDMILEGVRALLVADEAAVVGLITAGDILGPRPVQFLQNPLCRSSPCRHEDISVGDIMTPWAELEMLEFDWVRGRTCGDVVTAFSKTDATHLVVVEGRRPAPTVVRGLLSRTRLARQLALS